MVVLKDLIELTKKGKIKMSWVIRYFNEIVFEEKLIQCIICRSKYSQFLLMMGNRIEFMLCDIFTHPTMDNHEILKAKKLKLFLHYFLQQHHPPYIQIKGIQIIYLLCHPVANSLFLQYEIGIRKKLIKKTIDIFTPSRGNAEVNKWIVCILVAFTATLTARYVEWLFKMLEAETKGNKMFNKRIYEPYIRFINSSKEFPLNTWYQCANCKKTENTQCQIYLKYCKRCQKVKYCGRRCQKKHLMQDHKQECSFLSH